MKIVIGNYAQPTDSRNLILNDKVVSYKTGDTLSPLFALVSKITGLEAAEYRNGTGNWSGIDGGYLSNQYYGARTIVIEGAYIDKQSRCDMSATLSDQFDRVARLYIRSRLPVRTRLQVRIFLDNGMVFYTDGYCTDLKMDYEGQGSGEYQITMYCPEPALFRGSGDGSIGSDWHTAMLYKEKSVGYTNPVDERDIEWSTGGRSAPVDYVGDYYYYPEIVVDGPVINPRFELLETGQWFELGHDPNQVCKFVVSEVTPSYGVSDLGEAKHSAIQYISAFLGKAVAIGGHGEGLTVEIKASDIRGIMTYWKGLPERDVATVTVNGSGYEVGDFVAAYPQGGVCYQPTIFSVAEVDSDGGIVSLNNETTGDFGALSGRPSEWPTEDELVTCDLTAISGSGSNAECEFLVGMCGTTVQGGKEIVSSTITSGGWGYEVGDVVYFLVGRTALEYEVKSVAQGGAIVGLEITQSGQYDTDYTARHVTLMNAGTSTGSNALATLDMEQGHDGIWRLVDVSVEDGEGGIGYEVGDILTPYIIGDSIFSISSNQKLTIDMYNRSVMVDGSSRSFYIASGSEWFALQPNMINHIAFTSDGANDTKTALIRWRNAYQGI